MAKAKKIKPKFKIKSVKFIEGTDLVPESWSDWFWGVISSDAPFSWGDNNRTLVTADRFHDHCKDVLEPDEDDEVTQEEIDNFLKGLEELGQIYIDLEN